MELRRSRVPESESKRITVKGSFKHSVVTALAPTVVVFFYKHEGYPATEQTLCIDREIPSLRIR
jgi:hypothetical protein